MSNTTEIKPWLKFVEFDSETKTNSHIPWIKSLTINKLFGERSFYWCLNQDVNVLVGNNGSGKSSILEMLYKHLSVNFIPTAKKASSEKIQFSNGCYVDVHWHDSEDELVDEVREPVAKYITSRNRFSYPYIAANEMFAKTKMNYCLGDESSEHFNLLSQINVEYLSTFDMQLMSRTQLNKIGDSVITQLDVELEKDLSRFISFQLALSRRTSKQYRDGVEEDFAKLTKDNFIAVSKFEFHLNQFFAENNKRFEITEEGQIAVFEADKSIDLNQLSAGEKQLILIMLRVVISSGKPTILMFDEPEISLHLSWQEKLISTIRDIHPQCQLIIVTHSPAIIMDGWKDKMIDIEQITVNNSEVQ